MSLLSTACYLLKANVNQLLRRRMSSITSSSLIVYGYFFFLPEAILLKQLDNFGSNTKRG